MLIKTPKKYYLKDASVTEEKIYYKRRQLLKQMGVF